MGWEKVGRGQLDCRQGCFGSEHTFTIKFHYSDLRIFSSNVKFVM